MAVCKTEVTHRPLPTACLVYDLFKPGGVVSLGFGGERREVPLDAQTLDGLHAMALASGSSLQLMRYAQLVGALDCLREVVGSLLWAHCTMVLADSEASLKPCKACGWRCDESWWASDRKCCPDCSCRPAEPVPDV